MEFRRFNIEDMKNLSGTIKLLLLLAFALIGIFAVQACIHSPPAVQAGAPYVVDFSFQKPVPIGAGEEERLKAALEKYAVPNASKIKIDGTDFWPPVSSITTDRVATSGRDEVGLAFISRGRATQRLSFKTPDDLRSFMRAISKK